MIDQENRINRYKEGMAQKMVAQASDTTQGYVSKILHDNDVDTGFTKWWEDDEVEFLKKNYPPVRRKNRRNSWKIVWRRTNVDGGKRQAGSLGLPRPQDEYGRSESPRRIRQ